MARNWWKLWTTFRSWLIFHRIRVERVQMLFCGVRAYVFIARVWPFIPNVKYIRPLPWKWEMMVAKFIRQSFMFMFVCVLHVLGWLTYFLAIVMNYYCTYKNIIFCAHSFITNYVKRSTNVIAAFLLCEPKCAFADSQWKSSYCTIFLLSVSFHLVLMVRMLFAIKEAFCTETIERRRKTTSGEMNWRNVNWTCKE